MKTLTLDETFEDLTDEEILNYGLELMMDGLLSIEYSHSVAIGKRLVMWYLINKEVKEDSIGIATPESIVNKMVELVRSKSNEHLVKVGLLEPVFEGKTVSYELSEKGKEKLSALRIRISNWSKQSGEQ